MLHELLLALQGYCGSIFIKNKDNQIKVVDGLLFLHPSETSILQKLCSLGTTFSTIQDFISENTSPGEGKGVYRASFCQGLSLILNDYKETLLLLEQDCLKDPSLPLSHFRYKLNEFEVLFPVISLLIDKIKSLEVNGCSLLDLIYKSSISGIPYVRSSFKRILQVANGVLYKQLTSWLLYGILTDEYKEFFIHQNFDVKENELDEVRSSVLSEREENPNDSLVFMLKSEMLPSYLSLRVAYKILFIGQSINLFSQQNGRKSNFSTSMFDGKESEFCEQLFNLQQMEEFSSGQFEIIIDNIRSTVAEHLWKLVVSESDLIGKLVEIKNYFLLARGELFLAFVDNADKYLELPTKASTEHDVNKAFQAAARNISLDERQGSEVSKFTLKIRRHNIDADNKANVSMEPGWKLLGLEYNVSWPLHILFTSSILARYEIIFKFLMNVKLVQSKLHKCWSLQMLNKEIAFQNLTVWQLRNHMSFIIDNLQYYLQADVLESQFTNLIKKINATRDFEEIQQAHEVFLTSILSQSFQLIEPISKCLNSVLEISLSFCKLVKDYPLELWEENQFKSFQELNKRFNHQVAILFKMLSSVGYQSFPFLSQLLLRIDFNKFLSSMNGQLGV